MTEYVEDHSGELHPLMDEEKLQAAIDEGGRVVVQDDTGHHHLVPADVADQFDHVLDIPEERCCSDG